jgi:hypothetical protein
MPTTYSVQISDVDYKALCYVAENPHQYCDDKVTEYIQLMKKDMAQYLIKQEFNKIGTRNIPATIDDIIMAANIKTAQQLFEEDELRMRRMMQNPDDVEDIPPAYDIP